MIIEDIDRGDILPTTILLYIVSEYKRIKQYYVNEHLIGDI